MANEEFRVRDTNLTARILAFQAAKKGKIPNPVEYAQTFQENWKPTAERLLAEMAIHEST